MGSRKENMREWRRQADPSFPVAVKSRPSKPPPPRPSEPPPSRPTEPPVSSHMDPCAVPSEPPPLRYPEGVLKGHKGRKKRKNKKDLRVSFDLENTQERIVPQEEEEEVVECWEDLSDGEVWSAGAPEACDNFFNDDLGASVSVDSGAEPPSEVHDYEGFTYFGIRESDCTDEVDELLDAPESRPRGMENDMSPVYQGGGITDRELVEEQTSVSLDTELTDIQYPEELADMSFMEGFTEVSHSDEVSHTEGLTEVRCPDELNDVSFMSLGESRDELSCTEVAESKRPEQLTNITYLVELNDGSDNVESLTDVKNSEEMTDTCHEEGLTDVTFPEDLADMSYFEKLTHQRNSPEIPCLERVTDMSQLYELDNISRIEQLTDVSLSDELPYVTQSDELTDAKHLEEKQSERSHLGGPADPSHAELSDVPQLEALTDVSYPDEMDNFYAKPTTGSHAEQNCSEGLTIVSQPEKVIITLEEVNDDSDNEELSDMNKDKLITVNHDMVTERAQHTGSQEDTFFTVSDTNTPPCESLRETPGSDRERCSPSPSIEAEADTRTESVTGLTCEGEIELTTAPLASHPEEDEPKGDLEEDDDEWETDPSGDSEETSESTWGAAETESRPSAGERTTGDGCEEDSDCLIPSDDIEAVLALIEDQEKAMPYVSQTLAQDENHILASEPALREDRKGSEREASPQVTVGYECRDRKSTSHYASETESEGELVPCEDKCVGTADQSDEDLLNVSPAENVSHEGGIRQNIVNECQERDLSLDKSKQCTLAAPEVEEGSSPSPEIPELPEEGKCFGNSESGKEKDKINGKKIMKKKGKKNKREAKVEPLVSPVDVLERPKLVRGRGWKAKQGEINVKRVALQNLSFGNEVCESEVVEGTSNLLTETYTETALLTPTRCPLGTTVFTETPCTACSTVSGEFSEPDNLHDHCKCGEQQREDAGLVALVAEVKTCKEAPKPALGLASSLSPPVTVEVTGASDEEDHRVYDAASSTEDTNEFFIVKTQTVASPSHVLTEYVEDTESEEDMKIKDERVDNKVDVSFQGLPASTCDSTQTNKSSPGMAVQNESCIYIDAEDSGCIDTLNEQFDYDKSFPKVLGTQHLNVKYTYDSGTDTDSESSLESIEGEGETPDLEGSDMKANLDKQGHGDRLYTSGWGEIIYEGPCLCGDTEFTRERLAPPTVLESVSETGESGAEEELCVPAMRVSNTEDVATGDGDGTRQEATGSELPASNMGSNQEDQVSEGACSAKDIRMRINEIVGARLLRDRCRVESPCVGDENGSHEEQPGGREESPLPGSSPASSSGVQGSDEMSVSRSRSRSPSREKSVSPAWASGSAPECSLEPRQSPSLQQDKYECEALESLRALRFEGNIEATPEKSVPLDCSFRTFRDMYQINPIYLTDSDDHEDLNESDTVVPVSTSLEHDPERSITVTSWSSASDCSPDPPELRSSSPLHGTHATKKVPKVTKLLRETQGIVQRWEALQAQAVERQRQSSQVRELQRQVKTLRLALEALGERATELTKADDINNRVKLIQKLQEVKALQLEVTARKSEVSSINLAVHRFLTETGYSLASLKDDVADLYRLWDEADRRVSSEASRLENVDATWKLWESQAEELSKMLRQDSDTLRVLDVAIQTGSMTDTATASMQGVARLLNEKRKTQPGKKLLLQHTKTQSVDIKGSSLSLVASGDECLSDSGTSGYESCSSEELSERERRLANLRRLARDLEASLHPNSQAWAAICKTLTSAETELKDLQHHCRELVVRSSETLDQAKTSPQLRRRMWSKDCKVGKASRRSGNMSGSGRGGSRRGWVWRVVRAALPFQAALLLLFCVACLLEPNCCDHVNTLNLSLSPQLRYVHGPPPV